VLKKKIKSNLNAAEYMELLLNKVNDASSTIQDIAKTYSKVIEKSKSFKGANWKKVNRAIIEKRGLEVLENIKTLAWKMVKKQNKKRKK